MSGYNPSKEQEQAFRDREARLKKINEDNVGPPRLSLLASTAPPPIASRGLLESIEAKKVPDKTYTVSKGDSLSEIARATETSVARLQKLNNIKNANKLKIGQELKIPLASSPTGLLDRANDAELDAGINHTDHLARLLYAEGASEDEEGMRAIANVMNNRLTETKYGFGNRKIIADEMYNSNEYQALRKASGIKNMKDASLDKNKKAFAKALKVAKELINGTIKDNTDGALFYRNPTIDKGTFFPNAIKNKKLVPIKTVGNHVFYRQVF
jgi:spore germination cell wall hydrolase CwlJ-like protein